MNSSVFPHPAQSTSVIAAAAHSGQPQREVRRGVSQVHGDANRLDLQRAIRAELTGAGRALAPLLSDPQVTDILINGTHGVWVERNGSLQRTQINVEDPRSLAVRLAALAGQRLDDAAPVVDGRLPDGTRLHAILAPLASGGAAVSLRTFRPQGFSLPQLRDVGLVDEFGDRVLQALVSARCNGLISGATGSGKTSLLGALLGLVPPHERLLCIEEATELRPQHPHVVHLQTRKANVQGKGEVSLAALVKAALRMRPDRLVLGECRGEEVRELLSALNTGHDGGWSTIHANGVHEVPARLQALGSQAALTPQAVTIQARAAFDVVLHLHRDSQRIRRLASVAFLSTDEHGGLLAKELLRRQGQELVPTSNWDAFVDLFGLDDSLRTRRPEGHASTSPAGNRG